ncbi:TonB-dependent receptor [Roseateles toxinivorans]|uniref:TonB-dependent receptor-like protein n=1 Tax=Roseateles toxinivorans TaxID=270368 RepID=A0A4R6QN54_9BURK|nr:TonB-dependent receptor [Roseateles toxinivorans]TDP72260.1 TonB-dependent receptor-like protein [Roseateles toxinivorans]
MQYRRTVVSAAALVALLVSTGLQAQTRSFDIPSDAAVRSIPLFARQAGVQIVAPADGLGGVSTPAIQGNRDVRTALGDLLIGTGLVIASDTGDVITLQRGSVTAAPPAGPAALATVIVTGSRLAQFDGDSPTPVLAIGAEALAGRGGGISVGDQLSQLPQFRATFTQAASTGIGLGAPGQVGLNLLDLRGLGTTRTLVLQNGRRVVSSSQQLAQPDTNTIPMPLLKRVEVLTGGASAIYGADAIAGVVNFVLMDNFDGMTLRAQYGTSQERDADSRSASIAVGRNLAGGKANIAASLEIAGRSPLGYSDRSFSVGQSPFVPNPKAGQPGEPTQILVNDIRWLSRSTGGTLPYGPPFYRFAANGSLNPADTGSRSLLNLGISEGGDGTAPVAYNTLLPRNERIAANLLGHIDLSAQTRIFGHVAAIEQRSAAFNGPILSTINISKSNPYLSAQALTVLNSYGPTATAPGFVMLRDSEDLGIAGESVRRSTLRGVAGVKGSLSGDWSYELSVSLGRVDITSTSLNNLWLARIGNAADAVVDINGVLGNRGAIVCASRLAAGGAATGNADIDQCVPANFFGNGSVSAAARNYLSLNTAADARISQKLLGGFINGDSAAWFKLPAGPVGVVAGFEHRQDNTRYTPDARDAAGLTGAAGVGAVNGSLKVTELFSEFKVPLLAKLPMVDKLELTASMRTSDYNLSGVGRTNSWGLGGLWQINRQISLRASTQKAVRAPNVAELYEPVAPVQVGVNDPCSAQNIALGSPTRAANCAALGMPAGFRANTLGRPITATSGGNANLTVEDGDSRTLGVLLAPAFAPGFAVSVDYYRINLKNAITKPNSNQIITTCVDSTSINNPFCGSIQRGADFNIRGITQQTMNLTRQFAEGLDVDATYGFALPGAGRADLRAIYSHVLKRDDYLRPTEPSFPSQMVERVGNPRDSLTFTTNLAFGALQLTHKLRWFSGQWRGDPADFVSVGGLPARNPNLLPQDLRRTQAESFHDLRASWQFGKGREIYLGVENVSNVKPPPGIYGAGFGGANYDAVGRFFYTGIRYDFQ